MIKKLGAALEAVGWKRGARLSHDSRRLKFGTRESKIDLIRRFTVKRLMRPFPIVKLQIRVQMFSGFFHRVICIQIHVLILDSAPEPFYKKVIPPAALAIHTYLDFVLFESASEFRHS